MVIRLSVPPRTAEEHAALKSGSVPFNPEPVYGTQLQEFAVPGIPAEGKMAIAYEEIPFELNGDEGVTLRRPAYSVTDLGYGAVAADVRLSPRVAPPMIGLGLLEAVHPGDIFAGADPDDADGDGISGSAKRRARPEHRAASARTVRLEGIDPERPGADCEGVQRRHRDLDPGPARPVGRLHGGPTRVPDEAVRGSASPWRHRGPGAGAGARLVLCVEPRRYRHAATLAIPRFCAARRYSTGRDVLRATRRST